MTAAESLMVMVDDGDSRSVGGVRCGVVLRYGGREMGRKDGDVTWKAGNVRRRPPLC